MILEKAARRFGRARNLIFVTHTDASTATAKRGENVYKFVFNAIIKEQIDAWRIEIERLKHKSLYIFGLQNKLIKGYLRSIIIASLSFFVGGLNGLLIFLLCAFTAKSLLEVINYIEHYGLVRVKGEKVMPRHSWNSNSVMSSIYLYNVTRHSAHHEKPYLKFWELDAYQNAPMMPYGYLSMLYMTIFTPFYFQKIMSKNSVPTSPNNVRNKRGKSTAILPSDFENR